LTAWSRSHPEVEAVCRDGSATYAEAIRRALPDAVQVSDRRQGTVATPLLNASRDTAESLMEALAETRFLSPRGPEGTGRFLYHLGGLPRLFARERALAEESPDFLAHLSAPRIPRPI
jgi:hypothetical protein